MTHKRWLVSITVLAISAVAYIDRAKLPVAEPVLIKDFHTSDAVMGLVLSSYLWTYAALQIPSGALVDRIAARVLYALTPGVWALASFGTALVSSVGALFGASSRSPSALALTCGKAAMAPTTARARNGREDLANFKIMPITLVPLGVRIVPRTSGSERPPGRTGGQIGPLTNVSSVTSVLP